MLAETQNSQMQNSQPDDMDNRIRCRAGRSSFAINWQGNMRPCIFLTSPQVPVFENGFSESWKQITEVTDSIRLSEKCANCSMRKVCQNCAACAMAECGSFDGVPEYMCRYTEETLKLFQKELGKTFQIGEFCFRLCTTDEVKIPEDFMKFENSDGKPECKYEIQVSDTLPVLEGKLTAKRSDILIYTQENTELESRSIGIRGSEDKYACYQETAKNHVKVTLCTDRLSDLHIDPVFSSLLALERKMIARDSLIFHCSYLRHNGEAILFSGPSGIGKSTQAGLWETYQNGEVINGDRALLNKIDGRWTANGWPVSGTSGVCKNISTQIKAIVMLNQSEHNQVQRITGLEAVRQLYAQTTVNYWNVPAVEKSLELLEDLIAQVPVFYLNCDISEEAVNCLTSALLCSKV